MNSDRFGTDNWTVRVITHSRGAGSLGSWMADIRTLGGKPVQKMLGATKAETSAEQLELRGVIAALRFILGEDAHPEEIQVWTSSNYVKMVMTEWYPVWEANGWRLSTGGTPRNSERIKELWNLREGLNIKWLNLEDGDHLDALTLETDLRDDPS